MPQRTPTAQWHLFMVRIILPTALTLMLFLAGIFLFIVPVIERNSLDHKKEMIRELTDFAGTIITRFENDEQRGLLPRQEAQRLAVEQIRTLQYGRQMKDYFWINDMQPRMILHPYRTDLIGRDVSGFLDADGKPVFKEVIDIVKKQGSGYVQYRWQLPDNPGRIATKLSYVQGFPSWGWVLGTGMYIEDLKEENAHLVDRIIQVSQGILIVIVLLLSSSIIQAYRSDLFRRRAEQALQQSEEKYRTIFENTGTATCIIAEDMTIALVNSMFEELSGFTKTEIEGKKALHDFVHADDYEWMEGYHYARIFNPSSAPRNYEFRFVDRSGCIKDIFMTIAVVPDTKLCVASFLDMTEHKRALRVRAESEERLKSLVENSLIGIYILQDSKIVYYNPEQERLFGPISPDFRIGNYEKVYPEDVPKVQEFYERILSGELNRMDIDYRFYSMGSESAHAPVRWAYCRATAIDYMGRRAVLVNMMDVTRAKELEYMLGIKDKMISLGHVAAGIAHEIRNPLSGINIFLDSIRENFEDAESSGDIRNLISQAQAAAGKIESVVKGVLDFARPGTPRFDMAGINGPIQDALMLTLVTLRKSDISVETDLAENLPPVHIDVQQMEQVMLNLITNAAEALRNAREERRIAIRTFAEEQSVVVQFSDSGGGIPPEQYDKIFDPFYTTKSDGSGIGLSIVRRIVADHRGRITVSRSVWGGALFEIRLPSGALS
jgi:PAS domain S-box-containing protein